MKFTITTENGLKIELEEGTTISFTMEGKTYEISITTI